MMVAGGLSGGVFLLRGAQDQGQGVQAGSEFCHQGGIDGAVAGDAGQAAEGGGDGQNGVVRFAAGAGAGVAGMVGAVIGDAEQAGGKTLPEDGFDALGAGRGNFGHIEDIGQTGPDAKHPVANGAGDAHKPRMTRRPARRRAYAPDPDAPGQVCEMPDCQALGEYRAPKSKLALRQYFWFCLEHVRAYNLSWDYYKGMTPGEIEAALRQDIAWGRPSWPLGRIGSAAWEDEVLRDPLNILASAGMRKERRVAEPTVPTELREPLATLGLSWPTTLDRLKTRYKELAKRHHPDANGGDKGAEERIKTINLAYATLRVRLITEPRLAAAG